MGIPLVLNLHPLNQILLEGKSEIQDLDGSEPKRGSFQSTRAVIKKMASRTKPLTKKKFNVFTSVLFFMYLETNNPQDIDSSILGPKTVSY